MNSIASVTIGTPLLIASTQATYWLLWGGSLALSVTLVILLWTRWGHSRPLHKCAVLSLIVHLILAFLTMTVRIVNGDGQGGGGGGGGPPIHVRIVEEGNPSQIAAATKSSMKTPKQEEVPVVAPRLLEAPQAKKEEPELVAMPEKAN